jgi:molybdate transport system ATP-binding protein
MIIKVENGITRHPDWRMAEPINIEILQGEQIAIVGDNAAGKSRLIEVLTGHYPLLMNEVKYNFSPSPLKMVSENLKYITFRDSYGDSDGAYYYQQRWNQHDIDENTPTVRELLKGVFKDDELKNKLTELFHLEGVMDKYIITLSSGELRKFQLMKALGQGPRVLIMDNPFIGLDAQTRDQLRELLKQLSEETYLLIIMILSKVDDIPDFITHIIPVEDLHILPKITRQEYQQQLQKRTYPLLPEAKRNWILQLPQKDLKKEDFYPQDGQEILKFNNVSIRYGSRTILKDLNWTVHEGEKWAMSGENGAGKSTLLSLVCADNPQAYACNIELFGHRRGTGESIWQIKRHIGYVSPEMHRAYLKDLPAIDIVASGLHDSVGLYTRPRPEQKQICLDWMEIFGIKELADRTFLKLSSGEQRLCLLARAFVKDPELLILDEPLHGLDLKNRALVKDIIDTFCQRPHKTLVMVTHYKQEFPKCITHSIFLSKK